MDFVDSATRKRLEHTSNVPEIEAILADPNVRWQSKARCLRHPFKSGGCDLPENSDIDTDQNMLACFN